MDDIIQAIIGLQAAWRLHAFSPPRNGAVAFAMTAFEQRDCWHESLPPTLCSRTAIGLRRLPLSTEVIVIAVRWYLRFGRSYRDVEKLLVQ